jgi:hypothetical protein
MHSLLQSAALVGVNPIATLFAIQICQPTLRINSTAANGECYVVGVASLYFTNKDWLSIFRKDSAASVLRYSALS